MSEIRICPFCKEDGETSNLTPSPHSSSTCVASSPGHYDEAGQWVRAPDPNQHTRQYSCSRGHHFTVVSREGFPDIITRPAP